ncbi:hypothetical protein JZ751_015600 [Albula glossodonta]|uniref:Uncharacterized protein n=1 Tax=Albula glossodonta TaxID=121402 RepID=A0A8T2NZA4_9TELE|nr:hypothetical protein JZ751_015600 [Albula glossodonta]
MLQCIVGCAGLLRGGAPESLLESLETHLNTLEGKKGNYRVVLGTEPIIAVGSPSNNGSPLTTPAKTGDSVSSAEAFPISGAASAGAATK